jgi:hypothetical protein
MFMADKEAIAMKLMHAFPWNTTAQVLMHFHGMPSVACILLVCTWPWP